MQSVFDAAQTADCSVLLVCASFAERKRWLVDEDIWASNFAQTTGLRVLIDMRGDVGVSVSDALAFAAWVHQRDGLASVAVMALCLPRSNSLQDFPDKTQHRFVAAEQEAVLFATRGVAPTVMEAASSAIAAAAAVPAPIATSPPRTDAAAAAAAIDVSPPLDFRRAAGSDSK